MAYITFDHVSKIYGKEQKVYAVNDASFEINKGELCVILGPSGAGKTTVLNLLGGMDSATKGQILVDGKDVTKMNGRQRTDYRRTSVGFVFQFYNLMPSLTALENVELARQVCRRNALDPRQILCDVGLGDRLNNFPAQLSGGEQQRVSIARALCKNPALLLCDEPTGALDSRTGIQVLQLLVRICREQNATVVLITHNALISPLGNRVIHLKNGGIESVEIQENPAKVEEIEW